MVLIYAEPRFWQRLRRSAAHFFFQAVQTPRPRRIWGTA